MPRANLVAHLAALLALAIPWLPAQEIPLGPLGGRAVPVPGTGLLRITSLTPGAPGQTAGLQVGDHLHSAFERPLGVTGTATGSGYIGAVQDLGNAIDRAEGLLGQLPLGLIRSGTGGLQLIVQLPITGSFGPAWPAGSSKADALYENGVARIHSLVQASSSADFGQTSGWFGLILLSHPDWNATSGPRPYRNSINKLRTRCENYLNSRILEPAEAFRMVNGDVVPNPAYVSPGLENWDVCTSAMFLALYRLKTADPSADGIVQRAAEMIAHRIQTWTQYDDPGEPHVLGGGIGRMGHGGVHGDYSHYNGIGALNIINAHAMPALGLLRQAGANMNLNLGPSINDFYAANPIQPTIEEKFRLSWNWMKQATNTSGGADDGNIGYVTPQSGWDSAGRTPGGLAGWHLYGLTPTADDLDKLARQEAYIARRWQRQQHAHAYTLGGVALSQLAMPFLGTRSERHFQENSRFFATLARQPDGTIAYFPGRENNGGDSYLDTSRVALVNATIAGAIRSGRLPGFPAPAPADRLHVEIRSPHTSWPSVETRLIEAPPGLSHALDTRVTDASGTTLAPSEYSAQWSQLSGPTGFTFTQATNAATTIQATQAGTYRLRLDLQRGPVSLQETYEITLHTSSPAEAVAPYVVTPPESRTVDPGGNTTLTLTAQGTPPLLYQWRRNGTPIGTASTQPDLNLENASAGTAGTYDCVITNTHGSVTSPGATVTVTGVGSYNWGGLWRDVFTGISGNSIANLTASEKFPDRPDVSGILTSPESPAQWGDNYGQRWSGWITPPQTGNYRFYIASDDASQLWLSTTSSRANRTLIAQVTGWTSARSWSTGGQSSLIPLTAGTRYYIEILHKEGGGGDHCAVTWNWASPGVWTTPANGSTPLPGAILEHQTGGTLDDDASPPANYPPLAHDQTLTIFSGTPTAITLTGEDFENAPLTWSVVTPPAKGTLSGTPPHLTYTPQAGASGTDSFRVTASDGALSSPPATISLTLVPEAAADLQIWTGASDASWQTTSNWLSGTAPSSTKAVVFDSRATANPATILSANTAARRIVLTDPPAAISITGSTLSLGAGIEMLSATRNLTIASTLNATANQTWTVGPAASLTTTGAISGNRILTKAGPGTLVVQGVSPTTGPWNVTAGTLELRGGGWYAGYVGGSGTLNVSADATAINVDAHSFGSSVDAPRDINLQGGTFRLLRETYFRNLTLNAGSIDNSAGSTSDLRARTGGSIVTVQAAAASSVISATFNLTGNTTFNVADGPAAVDLRVSAPLTNASTLTKSGAGRMLLSAINTHSGPFQHSAGTLTVLGSLASSTVTIFNDAILEGTGTLSGTINQTGELEPGNNGTATISFGAWTLSPAADTRIEIAATGAGSGHDRVQVAGHAALAGLLDVSLLHGFVPEPGDRFDLLAAGSRSGTFGAIQLPTLPADRRWITRYDPDGSPGLSLLVEAIPPYEQWTAQTMQGDADTPGISGPLDDPDGDGISNLLEYALGLAPREALPLTLQSPYQGLPVAESASSGISLVYRRNLAATDLQYIVETTHNLALPDSWHAATVQETILHEENGVRTLRATITLPPDNPQGFLRLRILRQE
jgi:autotransporter-associated beta strand protein